ncbi:hypothetical protein CHS0354_016150 [Potamilus streckersoni]|uniref:LRRCT domain-containing protein n=1 Tax=Potamilus streckersoni TaxID=2493646 RepID=A0AAE0W0Q5_9BIVA|nr:hypothetical protein CHS0354_016150 [Potamilus streckersoni]
MSDISKCKYEQSTFNCSGVGLQNIPDEKVLPPGLRILDLSYNNIAAVPFLNFAENVSSSLTQLLLSHNQINIIQNFSFSKLHSLETLDLSFNSLSEMDIDRNTFANISALQELVLDHNPLRIIRRIAFTDFKLPSLRNLSLSHCELIKLENAVIGFKTLNVLNLSWNHLNSTSIQDLPIIVTADFNTLDLSHNEITELDIFNFPSVYGLKNLILDHNPVTRLNLIYVTMYQIQTLSFRDNNIQTLDNTSLNWDLNTLGAIDFKGNPIVCDCKLSWLLMDTKLKSKTVIIVCDTPHVLRGRNLFDLTLMDINCTDHHNHYTNHHDYDQNIFPILIGVVLAGGVLRWWQ